ncbi:oligosaccharide flippase family protein [Carnobacterium maltaromaticum]|uniref:oligosaccharide flippase family protein n=2 Tax=Carnobacterium maltaromaticum TaxID=2751 RepID=UPI00295EEFD3|nr:oligosaccharide flippase family protein [Carnobacterium maltaromaticum]
MKNKMVSNYIYSIIYQLLITIIPIITLPYTSRVLGDKMIGIDASVMAVVQLFVIFCVLNVANYGSRAIATAKTKEETSQVFWNIYTIQFIASSIVILCYIFFIIFTSSNHLFYLIHLFTLGSSLLDISWYFYGKEELKKTTARNIAVRLVTLVCIFVFIKGPDDLWKYILINSLSAFIGQLVLWKFALANITFMKPQKSELARNFWPMIQYFLPLIASQIYLNVNRIILSTFSGDTEVGYYSQASKIVRMVIGFITPLSAVFLPRVANEFDNNNHAQVRRYMDVSSSFVCLISFPIIFGLIAIGQNFITLFLGQQFLASIPVLKILAPSILLVGLANVFGVQLLLATNKPKQYTLSVTVGAIISLIINYIFVGRYGSIATSYAELAAELIGLLIQIYFIYKIIDFNSFLKNTFTYALFGFIMFVAINYLPNLLNLSMFLEMVIQIIVGALVYLALLVFSKNKLFFTLINKVLQRG